MVPPCQGLILTGVVEMEKETEALGCVCQEVILQKGCNIQQSYEDCIKVINFIGSRAPTGVLHIVRK